MLFLNGKQYICNINRTSKTDVASLLNLCTSEFYLLCNGKIISEIPRLESCRVDIVLRLPGGKGGFGSMLRAIGAQIEKTTNREACRDLSGRRLRDINEEKRLKAWISQQAEREREVEDRRKKKLERLCQKPKHEFKDETYEKERTELTDRVEDALEHGLSIDKGKRKSSVIVTTDKKKKPRLWLGSDDELSTTDEDTDNDEISITNPSTSKVDDSNTTKIDNNIASNSNSNSSDVTPKDLSPMNQNKDENLQEPEVKMSNEIQPEERGK